MDTGKLVELKDRMRLLIQAVARTNKDDRQKAMKAFDNMSLLKMQSTLVTALTALQSGSSDEHILQLSSEPYMFIAAWWVSWTIPISLVRNVRPLSAPCAQVFEVQDTRTACLTIQRLPEKY